jgi:hypothetical protein
MWGSTALVVLAILLQWPSLQGIVLGAALIIAATICFWPERLLTGKICKNCMRWDKNNILADKGAICFRDMRRRKSTAHCKHFFLRMQNY